MFRLQKIQGCFIVNEVFPQDIALNLVPFNRSLWIRSLPPGRKEIMISNLEGSHVRPRVVVLFNPRPVCRRTAAEKRRWGEHVFSSIYPGHGPAEAGHYVLFTGPKRRASVGTSVDTSRGSLRAGRPSQ